MRVIIESINVGYHSIQKVGSRVADQYLDNITIEGTITYPDGTIATFEKPFAPHDVQPLLDAIRQIAERIDLSLNPRSD